MNIIWAHKKNEMMKKMTLPQTQCCRVLRLLAYITVQFDTGGYFQNKMYSYNKIK